MGTPSQNVEVKLRFKDLRNNNCFTLSETITVVLNEDDPSISAQEVVDRLDGLDDTVARQ